MDWLHSKGLLTNTMTFVLGVEYFFPSFCAFKMYPIYLGHPVRNGVGFICDTKIRKL